ncbi:hypothetical protein [Hallella colorans]|uniref:hypothetical protein n=1 Tax=Hallella colorans TaxID=1703337 RepID=UPI00248E62E1|nr:hypothetical protein [Hallella colorans]
MRKNLFQHIVVTLAMVMTLSSCSILTMRDTAQVIGNLHHGQTYEEVVQVMRGKPQYRRFTEEGLEQWEYRRNMNMAGDYDVIIIGFRDGRVISMDSFRYVAPYQPTIKVDK